MSTDESIKTAQAWQLGAVLDGRDFITGMAEFLDYHNELVQLAVLVKQYLAVPEDHDEQEAHAYNALVDALRRIERRESAA